MTPHLRDPVVEVLLTWGAGATGCALAYAQLPRGGHFSLGEGDGCDAIVPTEVLGSDALDVVRWDGQARVLPPPGARVSLDGEFVPSTATILGPGQRVEVSFGDFVLRVSLVEAEPLVALRRPSLDGIGGLLLSAAAHASCLAALALSAASIDSNRSAESRERLRIMRHLIEASADQGVVAHDAPHEPSRSSSRAAPNEARHPLLLVPPPANPRAELPGKQPEPGAGAEPSPKGDREGAGGGVDLEDVGGLLASLKRRLSTPLPGGFAHVGDRGGPEASLRYPYPIVSDGRLDKEVIQRIVAANARSFRACYQGKLRSSGASAPRVAVTFVVGRFGQVVTASDAGGDVPDPDVRACIVKEFYALTFPAPERGTATLTYPLQLTEQR